VIPVPKNRQLFDLGEFAACGARKHPHTTVTLEHPLALYPELGEVITVAQFAEAVDDCARRLVAAGARPGDRVAVYLSGGFDICLLACAVARVGAVPVMLSPHLDAPTMAALLERLEQPVLVTDDGQLGGWLKDVDTRTVCQRTFTVGPAQRSDVDLRQTTPAAALAPVPVDPDGAALMTHTSGTTGIPKLVVHSQRSLGSRFRWQMRVVRLINRHETVALETSFVHSRMYLGLAVLVGRGMPMVFLTTSDLDKVADTLVRHRPGVLETHPNSYLEWEQMLADPRRPISSVKYFNSTFDAIHPSTMKKFLHASDRKNPVFLQVYGQSECGPLAGRIYTRASVERADGRCQGYPMPGIGKYRVVPRDGKPSRDNPGYIEVQTSGRALGYFGEPERFEAQLHGGWWRGGDVGYLTRRGCLHLLDREVDVIEGIGSALEVEDLLLGRLEELTELVIVRGAEGEAIPVVCTKGDVVLDVRRWSEAVRDVAAMASPRQLPLRALPRTATAKIRRIELSRRIREEDERDHALFVTGR
jgi:acyl-coenzyme A synthetase/AMP-(fatty) acid ligase